MKRTMGLEVLVCPQCHGRMELITTIEDPAVARKILVHLNLPARPPPRGRPLGPKLAPANASLVADLFDGVDPPLPID